MVVYAGVEGGGTTWRVALAEGHPTNITEIESFETLDDPQEQLRIIKEWLSKRKYDCLGIGTFGPVDPKLGSPTYGFITTTPKPGWANVDVVGSISDGSVPCKFDTDVNAPALAEYMWGAGNKEDTKSCAYITVGTGVGVGLVINGAPVHGLLHPEAGHLCLQRMHGDKYDGADALFGGGSIEGLASTVALADRKGCPRDKLPELKDDDKIWEPTAHSLGGLCASLVLVASPEKIILSGGVMNRTILYPMVRKFCQELLHGYIQHPAITTDAGIEQYITPSSFGQHAGMVGCLTLAHVAYEEAGKRGKGAGKDTVGTGKGCKGGNTGSSSGLGCQMSKAVVALSVVASLAFVAGRLLKSSS